MGSNQLLLSYKITAGGGGDPALVGSVRVIELSPGFTGNVTFTPAAGSTVIVAASCYNTSGTAVLTVTDNSGSNTWTTHENRQQNVNSVHLASAPNVAAASTQFTVTISGSSGDRYLSAVVMEFSGLLASSFDVSTGNVGASTSASSGTTAAKAQAHALVVSVLGMGGDNAALMNTGFTSAYVRNNSATYEPIAVGYKVVNASGTESASLTLGVTEDWAMAIGVWKAAA